MGYSPEVVAFTLSRKCNIACRHCIVDAGPHEREILDQTTIAHICSQASDLGIRYALVYGGEPFLFARSELPKTIETIYKSDLPCAVGTNGFWGKSEQLARSFMSDLNGLSEIYDQVLSITFSVDEYHQPQVPLSSIVNIIKEFKTGNYPNLAFQLQTFASSESDQVLDDLFDLARDNSIVLIESNNMETIYPALNEEFVEFCPENFSLIGNKFGLPPELHNEDHIKQALYLGLKFSRPQTVIAREIDRGEGRRPYLVFPDHRYELGITVEQGVINAGRAKGGDRLQLALDYGLDANHLIISPTAEAYAYPAQMTEEAGVPVTGVPLSLVISEVGRRLRP